MTWYRDARRTLKIDGGIFLRMVLGLAALMWPLMLLVRLVAGASLLTAALNILTSTLVVVAFVMLGVLLFEWFYSHSAAAGVRRWSAVGIYGVLLVTAIGAHAYYGSTQDYLGRQPNQLILWVSLIASRLIGVGLAVYVYFYLLRSKQATAAKAQVAALELMGRDAEIERLRAQINPHFLFNTLTAISNRSTDPSVDNIILKLSDVLRYNLSHVGGKAPLREEFKAMESYLQIEQMRFGSKLEIDWEVSPAARAALVPQPLLLPLLENAIKYGFETSPDVLRIRIAATVQGHELCAVVENTGRWIEPATLALRGTQIGLSNLKRRLELYYHGRAHVLQESLPEAVRITLTLPLDPAS
jgi:sensor histidine kinase YesM